MTLPYIDNDAIASNGKVDKRKFNKGRPKKGEEKGTSVRWEPKKLTPSHYAILSLRSAGLTHQEIAKEVKKSKPYIINVCTSKKGRAYIDLIVTGAAERFKEETEERLVKTSAKAVKNIEAVLNDEELLQLQPFRMYDRSMTFLKATGKMRGDAPAVMGGSTLTAIGDSAIKAMAEALKESNSYVQKEEILIESKTDGE